MRAGIVLAMIALAAVAILCESSACLPFDPFSADLLRGDWSFSIPSNITHPNCVRKFTIKPQKSSSCPEAKLRRIGATHARECLRNRHIVFVGDSVTRHQFEALIVFLETGAHEDNPTGTNPTPHSDAFGGTNYNGCGGPHYRCDIHRGGSGEHATLMHNGYYHNAQYNLNVTVLGVYAQAFGHDPVGWFPDEHPFEEGFAWSNGSVGTVADVIRKAFGMVDVVVANVGVWGTKAILPDLFHFQEHYVTGPWERARDELAKLQKVSKQTPVWATTTRLLSKDKANPTAPRETRLGAGYTAATSLGWRILDRQGMTSQLLKSVKTMGLSSYTVQTDPVHFVPFVNDEYNNVLLNVLCGPPVV